MASTSDFGKLASMTARELEATCVDEPITRPSLIQPHGVMLVLDVGDCNVVQVSENVESYLGVKPEDVLTRSIYTLLEDDVAQALRVFLCDSEQPMANPLLLPIMIRGRVMIFDAIIHRTGDLYLVELENPRPRLEAPDLRLRMIDPYLRLVHKPLAQAPQCQTVEELAQHITNEVKAFTGFDRVMVYRFEPDMHGVVIAESKEQDMDPYLGLHYPAGDIPEQARELYRRNWIRLISSASYEPVPLTPPTNPLDNEPVDMTMSVLRSVSPVHLEYLRNMGVGASMSISLVDHGKLWGLIACHHRTHKFVPYPVRAACVLFGAVVSAQIVTKAQHVLESRHRARQQRLTQALHRFGSDSRIREALHENGALLVDLFEASGMAVVMDGEVETVRETPDEATILRIQKAIQRVSGGSIIHATHKLTEELSEESDLACKSAGVLSINFGSVATLLLFRCEHVETVVWAGNPDKHHETDAGGRLRPRESFQAWAETVRGQSKPWLEDEINVARELHSSLTSVFIQRNQKLEKLNLEMQRKNQEMEQFIYTVSHDLKSPLVSCQGFVGLMVQRLNRGQLDQLPMFAQQISDATNRMSQLINDLLALSRIGRVATQMHDIDMQAMYERLKIRFDQPLKQRNAALIMAASVPTVWADETALERALDNLVSNAIKYGLPETGGRIELQAVRVGREVHVRVSDNGPGIDAAYHEKIFVLFERLQSDGEGTGVGLASVRKIAEVHHGRAWVESSPGHGATFCLALPHPSK